jgi:ribosome-binding protein aMBF1 (putative translation factor)
MITNLAKITQILTYHKIQPDLLNFDNTNHQKIGKRIQELRELQNLSQQDLAAKCNYDKSNMSRLESGRVNMTVSTLERVCKALNIDLIELFKF